MAGIFAPIIREALRQGVKYVYQGLRLQDKLIDVSYRKAGLYNRGVVTGVKHGLIAGQVIGGGLQLGLNADDSPGNGHGIQTPRSRPKARTQNKTRGRFSRSYRSRNRICYNVNSRSRRPQSRKY